MTIDYNASVAYYSFLLGNPKGWQLILPVSSSASKGDQINVIEVNAMGTPTGNTMLGDVIYARCNGCFEYVSKDVLVYVIPA